VRLRRVLRRLLLLGVMVGLTLTMALVGTPVPPWLAQSVAVITGVMTLCWLLS